MTTPEAEKPETAEATPAAVFVRPVIMTKRADFLAAAQGRRMALPGFHLQARFRDDSLEAVRVGFTCSKKVGNAVARNRAKRRLREAARLLTPLHGRAGCDYVFIARMGTADRDWDRLLDDVKSALTRLATPRAAPDMGDAAKSPARAFDDSRPSGQDR